MANRGFLAGLVGKESACNAGDDLGTGDKGLIPGLGRSPGEGNGNPRQYSCLEKPMDRGYRGLWGCSVSFWNIHLDADSMSLSLGEKPL